MFTGIVNSTGKVLKIQSFSSSIFSRAKEKVDNVYSLSIQSDFRSVSVGESISVNGVCLTVVKKKQEKHRLIFTVEISEETLKKTCLSKIQPGDHLNLERALQVNKRISGHFVQGHVDGVGKILSAVPQMNSKWFTFSYPSFLEPFIVRKGSIAVDGISLTIADLQDGSFSVSVLPFTEQNTSLANKKIGDTVNLETDILAKIVVKQLQRSKLFKNKR